MKTRTSKLPLPDINRFDPLVPLAKSMAADLLARGGTLLRATQDQVQIRRQGQVATIDKLARVSWRAFH